jgi:hypothetical protein
MPTRACDGEKKGIRTRRSERIRIEWFGIDIDSREVVVQVERKGWKHRESGMNQSRGSRSFIGICHLRASSSYKTSAIEIEFRARTSREPSPPVSGEHRWKVESRYDQVRTDSFLSTPLRPQSSSLRTLPTAVTRLLPLLPLSKTCPPVRQGVGARYTSLLSSQSV